MSHKNGTLDCETCAEKLAHAHSELAIWYTDNVKPAFPNAHISWSYRGPEDQEKCFKDGKSNAHYPMSPHNKTDDQGNPCALALDLFQLSESGQAFWPVSWFNEINKLCVQDFPSMEWGGNFTIKGKYRDFDHYQINLGETK